MVVKNDDDNTTRRSKGMLLIETIETHAVHSGLDVDGFLEVLGLTPSYYRAFRRGERWIGLIGAAKLEKIADFLNIPLATVYVMAGILQPADFVQKTTLTARLDDSFQHLQKHPVLGAFSPTRLEWEKTPQNVRLLAIVLYERLLNEELLDRGALPPTPPKKRAQAK